MVSKHLTTVAEVLRTAIVNPEFDAAWRETPLPAGKDYTIEDLKDLSSLGLPSRQRQLSASRPSNITESEHYLVTRDGWKSRTIVCHLKTPMSNQSPLIMLLFGGGHVIGSPESEVELARLLAITHNAVVVLSSYRLAPKYPFPYSANDSWDCLQAIAKEASSSSSSTILPSFTDATVGFILGGTSAGCALASVLAHLARDNNLSPPLTGQFLCAGSYISPSCVPPKYTSFYLSREQNKNAPLFDLDLLELFRRAHKPDWSSPLAFSFDQHNPKDAEGEVREGHRGLPPAYFQVCGLDISRDDSLIYEKVLREECEVQTRLSLFEGMPHCWWGVFPKLKITEERFKEAVDGFGWLLTVGSAKKREVFG
ncbi:hypothetical protein DV736_g2714, partial [Chaetothyriales sp. CBS 134916]